MECHFEFNVMQQEIIKPSPRSPIDVSRLGIFENNYCTWCEAWFLCCLNNISCSISPQIAQFTQSIVWPVKFVGLIIKTGFFNHSIPRVTIKSSRVGIQSRRLTFQSSRVGSLPRRFFTHSGMLEGLLQANFGLKTTTESRTCASATARNICSADICRPMAYIITQ